MGGIASNKTPQPPKTDEGTRIVVFFVFLKIFIYCLLRNADASMSE
jgi:hypothetical protein